MYGRCAISAVVATLLALAAGCTSADSAREKGVKDAKTAIAAGKLTIKDYPPPPSPAYYAEYIRMLRERGIEYEVPSLPPGVSEAAFIQEVRGWNETMEAEIDRQFGYGTLGNLRAEAQKRWQEKIAAPPKG